jgi:hypothetical protein
LVSASLRAVWRSAAVLTSKSSLKSQIPEINKKEPITIALIIPVFIPISSNREFISIDFQNQ